MVVQNLLLRKNVKGEEVQRVTNYSSDCWFKNNLGITDCWVYGFPPLCPLLLWYFGFWLQFICNMTTLFCIKVFRWLVCWAKNLLQFPFVMVRCSFDCSNHWEIIFRISFKPLRKWHCDCMDRFKISASHWLELWSLFSHIFCPPKNWHYQFGCLAHCGGGRAVFVWNFQINYTLVDWTGIKLCRHMAAVCFSSAYWQYWWQKSCMV